MSLTASTSSESTTHISQLPPSMNQNQSQNQSQGMYSQSSDQQAFLQQPPPHLHTQQQQQQQPPPSQQYIPQTQTRQNQSENIQINIHEPSWDSVHAPPNQIPSQQLNTIMNAIHQTGGATLPPRDMPTSSQMLIQDEQATPNYVEEPTMVEKKVRFAEEAKNSESMKQKQKKTQSPLPFLDLDNIHVPIIGSVLYFVFQLPFLNAKLYKAVPALFAKEGKPSIMGILVTSVVFGVLFNVIFYNFF